MSEPKLVWVARDPDGLVALYYRKPDWSPEEEQWEMAVDDPDLVVLEGWPREFPPAYAQCLELSLTDEQWTINEIRAGRGLDPLPEPDKS